MIFFRARLLAEAGDIKSSIEGLVRVSELDPSRRVVAAAAIERMMAQHRDMPEIHEALGIIYFEMGKFPQAKDLLSGAVKMVEDPERRTRVLFYLAESSSGPAAGGKGRGDHGPGAEAEPRCRRGLPGPAPVQPAPDAGGGGQVLPGPAGGPGRRVPQAGPGRKTGGGGQARHRHQPAGLQAPGQGDNRTPVAALWPGPSWAGARRSRRWKC